MNDSPSQETSSSTTIAGELQQLRETLNAVLIGQSEIVDQTIIALLAGGHVLVEGVPGLGKTLLVRALAKTFQGKYSRIQFTPDLMPSDVTGHSMYNMATQSFKVRKGPAFTNLLLADEINRAPAKTQSALLEVMQERQITIDGNAFPVPAPFMVLATQNPIEYEGTFPLPEAQLDRFLLRVRMGYPSLPNEIKILEEQQLQHPIEALKAVVKTKEVLTAIENVKVVFVSPAIKRYIVELTSRTRQSDDVYLGASPRGSLALFRTGQARAALMGRDHVLPDDVQAMAVPVLGHRIIVGPAARLREVSADRIVREIVENLAVPGGDYRVKESKGKQDK